MFAVKYRANTTYTIKYSDRRVKLKFQSTYIDIRHIVYESNVNNPMPRKFKPLVQFQDINRRFTLHSKHFQSDFSVKSIKIFDEKL
jgi:hypothetical protein